MPDPTPDPAQAVAALAAHVERVARRADATAARADEHEQHIRDLAEAVAKLARPGPDGPAITSWLDPARPDDEDEQPGEAAARLLADLAAWLRAVYLRYPGARLPSCWAWHPAVVEELVWLRGAHLDAYRGRGASWTRVGDWHERARPGVVRRIDQWIGGCELSEHRPGAEHGDTTSPAVPLSGHLGTVGLVWADLRETPVPTEQQLADASLRAPAGHAP
jgi:hypothetical protein